MQRQINRETVRLKQALRGYGICPCCCRGSVADEKRAVARARRRLDRAVVALERRAWENPGG